VCKKLRQLVAVSKGSELKGSLNTGVIMNVDPPCFGRPTTECHDNRF
jgi:hypothetical protein